MMINGRYHFKSVVKSKRIILSYLDIDGCVRLYIRTGELYSW